MLSHAIEAGNDWNTQNAVDLTRKAMNQLVASAPNARTAYILDVGDLIHSDSYSNTTEQSGHALDVDSRWHKVIESAIQCMCDLVDLALQKHEKVLYRSVRGNHNNHSATVVNIALKMRYSDEPRVVVLDSPAIHHYYQFGINLLADTHGDKTKPADLPIIMANDKPEMWASTTNRIWRVGHVHHDSKKDYVGCSYETYRTLAPTDAWHRGQGYRSNRDMKCTIYHAKNGMVGRNVVNPSMLGY